jgi:ABC-2 type transport system permease protein
MLAYRLRYYTGIITYLLFVSVHYFIWQAVFAERAPGERINGFTLPEMVSYITLGWVSRSMYFSDIDETIDDLVRSGEITVYLLRPVNFQVMMLVQAFGASLFRLTAFTLPLSLVIFSLYPLSPPASITSLLLFFYGVGVAFLVFALLNFLVGMLAFSLKSIDGIVRAKYYLVQLCSGLLLPLTFFPDWAERVLEVLPFKMLAYTPLQLYLGHIKGSELLPLFASHLFWIVTLFVLGHVAWRRARKKLTIQGG